MPNNDILRMLTRNAAKIEGAALAKQASHFTGQVDPKRQG